MSLMLMKPEHDVWNTGEHNGTFRGNLLVFVTAAAALDLWTQGFARQIDETAAILERWCQAAADRHLGRVKGAVLAIRPLQTGDLAVSRRIIVECCGPRDEVLMVMAPLNIRAELFKGALARLGEVVDETIAAHGHAPSLQLDDAALDPHDYGGDSITRPELFHRVADVEFDRLL
ncbi:4-aminobutyrate aminotransferase-like enzyme [Bradyrhizobium sp. ERR14]|nr:4-aminobutyrate aminotransferase-like enzyme [Bradyrhizobium sp. ERR14]